MLLSLLSVYIENKKTKQSPISCIWTHTWPVKQILIAVKCFDAGEMRALLTSYIFYKSVVNFT